MVGRVRRPWEGLTARIHDHAGVIIRHGEPDKDRDYRLVAKPAPVPTLTKCPECLAYLQDGKCPLCGHESLPAAGGDAGGGGGEGIKIAKEGHRFEFSSDAPSLEKRPVRIVWDAPGRTVEGKYKRTWEVQESWGAQRLYEIHGFNGARKQEPRVYEVPGTTRLDALMRLVPLEALVRVTYTEDTPLGGMKVRKEMKVEVDDGT